METTAEKTLRDLEEERLFRLSCEKFRYYEPNGKCEEFIKAVGDGQNFIVLFSAANGVGKTAAGANVVANLIWGKDGKNKYFEYPLYKHFPFPMKGRIISDPKNVEANLIPTLKEWMPEGRYTCKKGGKSYDSIWETDNGWEFDVMSYEQDPKEFESSTLGWAWFDEPPPESVFKATVARMRKGGIIFITETPLYAAWLYDHVIANPDQSVLKGQRTYIEADVEAACKEHGIRGHLEHDHIQRIIGEYSEEEKQARIYGKFQHLVGMRFKQFNRNIHVIKPFDISKQNFSVYEALDPHPRNNDMVNWIAVDDKGRKIVVNELWVKCQGGTEELAERIKNKADNYRIEKRVIDQSAFIEDQHTQQSLAKNLAGLGLSYEPASKNRDASDRRIEDALTYTKVKVGDHEEFLKFPELYIFDTCVHTIWEMEHYSWDEWKGRTAENRDAKEKTKDKDDHSIENVGRVLFMEPEFYPIPTFRQENNVMNYDPYSHVGE